MALSLYSYFAPAEESPLQTAVESFAPRFGNTALCSLGRFPTIASKAASSLFVSQTFPDGLKICGIR
jgi:hypothetical protein